MNGYVWSLYGNTMAAMAFTVAMLAWWYYRKRSGDKRAWTVMKKLVLVSKLLLPAITQTISRAFRCKSYDEGEATEIRVLLADPSIDCSTPYYTLMAVYASFMVVLFPIGVPLIWLIKLQELKGRFLTTAKSRSSSVVGGGGTGDDGSGGGIRDNSLNSSSSVRSAHHDNKLVVDVEDPVLSVSPVQTLFRGVKPEYASWYEVADMIRRLALTCGTMVFDKLAGFVLFSISVALVSLLVHTQLLPFDTKLMDNMISAAHWQTLIALLVLLIRDADMFSSTQYEVVGLVLAATNLFMLSMLLVPVAPQLKAEVEKVVVSARLLGKKQKPGAEESKGSAKRLSAIPDVQIFSNPSFRGAAPGRVAGGGSGLARPSAVAVVVEAELEDEGDKAHAAAVQVEMTEQRAGPVPGDAPVESAVEVSVWHDAGHMRATEIEGINPMRAHQGPAQ